MVWELGEYLGDRVLDTALIPSKRDSAVDISFGTLGGAFGRHARLARPGPLLAIAWAMWLHSTDA